MKLTGISIGYENNLIYKYTDLEAMKEFKAYLDATELKRINIINLWYEHSDQSTLFITVVPGENENQWKAETNKSQIFYINHSDENNLLDEIEDQLKINWYRSHYFF